LAFPFSLVWIYSKECAKEYSSSLATVEEITSKSWEYAGTENKILRNRSI
jgi:hypothetical protein